MALLCDIASLQPLETEASDPPSPCSPDIREGYGTEGPAHDFLTLQSLASNPGSPFIYSIIWPWPPYHLPTFWSVSFVQWRLKPLFVPNPSHDQGSSAAVGASVFPSHIKYKDLHLQLICLSHDVRPRSMSSAGRTLQNAQLQYACSKTLVTLSNPLNPWVCHTTTLLRVPGYESMALTQRSLLILLNYPNYSKEERKKEILSV